MAFGGQVDSLVLTDSDFLASAIAEMEKSKMPIEVHLPNKGQNYIFYSESPTLTRMRYFPIVLLSVIGLFLILSYVLFSISRRSEESKIWAGMAKETAHQLGTPISSLMGWVEVMKLNYPEEQGFDEMNKDVDRLTLVSERFSKIGSNPELSDNDLNDILQSVVEYMQRRTSNKISIQLHTTSQEHIIAKVNKHLIIWVFENLIRNAVDAIGTEAGQIDLRLEATEKGIGIEVSDTGKGIAASQQKRVFDPGYSTKLRGWGLGLSLSRRIVEEYHKGRIYVKSSTLGQGTVFRVVLKTNLGKNKG
jgi:signal transduction histidine kinase